VSGKPVELRMERRLGHACRLPPTGGSQNKLKTESCIEPGMGLRMVKSARVSWSKGSVGRDRGFTLDVDKTIAS